MSPGSGFAPTHSGDPIGSSNHQIGDLTFTAGPVVVRDGFEIFLSPMEFALLRFLTVNRGRVVPRTEILAHLYPGHDTASTNIVEVMVMRLRRKLSPHGEPDLVLTRRGVGYQIPADDQAANLPPGAISPFSGGFRAAQRWKTRVVG